MEISDLRDAKRRNKDEILAIDGVVSIGVGLDPDTNDPAIVIGYSTETPPSDIPSDIEGYPVITEYEQEPSPDVTSTTVPQAAAQQTDRYRPVQPGVSVNHYGGTACTGNFIFEDDSGTKYIGGNNHCYSDLGRNDIGDDIMQPSPWDGGDRPDDVIGQLADWVRLTDGGDNTADFAWAELSEPWTTEIYGVGEMTGPPKEPELGDNLIISGRTSGVQEGAINQIDKSINVEMDDDLVIQFDNIIQSTVNTDGGDSGSPVLCTDSGLRAVGVHFAGNDTYAYHCDITEILAQIPLDIVIQDGVDFDPSKVYIEDCSIGETQVTPGGEGSFHTTVVNDNPYDALFEVEIRAGDMATVYDANLAASGSFSDGGSYDLPETEGDYQVEIELLNIRKDE